MIRYVESGLFAHSLYFADNLAYKALFKELLCEVCIKGNSYAAVADCKEAFFLICFYKDIFTKQRNIARRQIKR